MLRVMLTIRINNTYVTATKKQVQEINIILTNKLFKYFSLLKHTYFR